MYSRQLNYSILKQTAPPPTTTTPTVLGHDGFAAGKKEVATPFLGKPIRRRATPKKKTTRQLHVGTREGGGSVEEEREALSSENRADLLARPTYMPPWRNSTK